jgi:hypothetical protein
LEILPIYCIRLAGFNAEKLAILRSRELADLSDNLTSAKIQIREKTNTLVDTLYHVIARENDPKRRNKILQIRRTLLNETKIRNLKDEEFSDLIPEVESHELRLILESYKRYDFTFNEFEKHYEAELCSMRELVKHEICSADFLHGILSSSESIYSHLMGFINSSEDQLRKRERSIEEALLNYFTRAITKTSPFATFTSVTICKSKVQNGLEKLDFEKKRFVLLDRNHLEDILAKLKELPEVRDELIVRVNPSLSLNDDIYHFFHENQVDDKSGSVALTWTIQSTPSIGLAVDTARKNEHKLRNLISQLCAEFQTDNATIRAFVEDLIRPGVLELLFPISELNHSYLDDVVQFIASINSETAKKITNQLKCIQTVLVEYRDSSEYGKLLSNHQRIKDCILTIQGLLDLPRSANSFIFEDSCLPKINYTLPEAELMNIHEELILLNQIGTVCFLSTHIKRMNLRHVFMQYWSKDQEVGLVDFFNKYSDIMIKSFVGGENVGESEYIWNPFNLEEVESLKQLQKKIIGVIDECYIAGADLVDVDQERVKNLLSQVPSFVTFSNYFSVYMQREKRSSAPWVLNEIRGGNLRYLSRFIYMTEFYQNSQFSEFDNYTQALNQPTEEGGPIYAELGGVFRSNNNVHNPLTKFQIVYPNSYHDGNLEGLIFLNELVIKLDADGFPILFLPRMNKRIVPLHIGLHNETYFPRLYQFLLSFELPKPFLPKSNVFLKSFADKGINMLPRVMLGKIMIARKRWCIKKDQIPQWSPDLKHAEYFLILNDWRKKYEIPERAFLSKLPFWIVSDDDNVHFQKKKKVTKNKNWSKPIFFDFGSPLLVNYFPKYLSNVDQNGLVVIEECYPDMGNLMVSSGEVSFVSEFLFEFKVNSE